MGLGEQLDYRYPQRNAFRSSLHKVASSRPGAWLMSKSIRFLDRLALSLTKGRTTVSEVVAGLPVIDVTTTGAKSGQPRTAQLFGIPTEGNLAILGTGFGLQKTPGWVFNLISNPRASVTYRNRTVDVTARRAEGAEADDIWATARELYDGYAAYRVRASHREIVVFVLEPE